MSARLLVSALPGEVRAAWLQDDRLRDYWLLREDRPTLAGSLYLGRIAAVDRGLDAAFVDLGLARPGLLPRKAARGVELVEGAPVAVQVTREPSPGKGAKLRAADDQGPAAAARPPALLARGPDPLARALAERPAPAEIVVDDAATLAELKRDHPGLAARMRRHLGGPPLFEGEGLAAEVEALLEPEVPLPGGGRLWIEPTRALTAIDVDAGGRESRSGATRLALETDLAAAAEIARQIRLRALSGLIVADFLELRRRDARERVVTVLRDALEEDPERASVSPMRASGLVEIARARSRPPLHELATEPCGLGGGGRVKTAASVAFEALRAGEREAAANPAAALAVVAHPDVIAALEHGPAAAARQEVERRLGRPLTLQGEVARGGTDYEVRPR